MYPDYYIPRVELGFQLILLNLPHSSILLHVKDKHTRTMLIMVTQDMNQDIVFWRMNLPTSIRATSGKFSTFCVASKQVFRRVISYLQYFGLLKYKQAITELKKIQEIYINDEDKEQTWKYCQCHDRACPMSTLYSILDESATTLKHSQDKLGTHTNTYIWTLLASKLHLLPLNHKYTK